MEEFEITAIFNYTHEIVILKHRLEQEGIQYFFENETMSSIAPFYSPACRQTGMRWVELNSKSIQTILKGFKIYWTN